MFSNIKVLIHIGTEKTGTTSIQSWLYTHRAGLLQSGIYTPGSFVLPGYRSHLSLALASIEDIGDDICTLRECDFGEFRDSVSSAVLESLHEARLENCCCLIFSSEHLSSRLLTAQGIQALVDLFPREVEVHVVTYLRPQHELLLGTQWEEVKSGGVGFLGTLEEIVNRDGFYGVLHYDYFSLISRWQSVVGKGRVFIRLFEAPSLVGGDVVLDFIDFLERFAEVGLSGVVAVDFPRENFSPSPEVLLLLSLVNSVGSIDSSFGFRNFIMERDFFGRGSIYSKSFLIQFFDHFSAGNSLLAREHFSREHLFVEPKFPERYVDDCFVENILKIVSSYRKSLENT